ncbi:MAG: hypothetical protein HOA08_17995 [Rhodospirillaceae bacterium]|jgi:hypothetical protein|nr:hypothetical protein [Rhodospirillaceae bacterium]MBT3494011.1 hypothetical protein [Rhodospirillaceae bacterium]MBT3778868.1 hypothetical protein [Rhodospirillaceae bacterium]MBT3976458.1 hypothetical protein [Rhodospirillaceae bacterium]MBT4170002.1 hypothetical protein [Rhodospirillaceae bacterium]
MLNPKTGLLLALVGILVGHYVYLHDLLSGDTLIMMGPASWTVAVVALVVALAGLWLLVRGNNDGAA